MITSVVQEVEPAVVTLIGKISARANIFSGYSNQDISRSEVIITEYGYILTNNHVVEGTQTLYVILNNGTKHVAELNNQDTFSDLSVIKKKISIEFTRNYKGFTTLFTLGELNTP